MFGQHSVMLPVNTVAIPLSVSPADSVMMFVRAEAIGCLSCESWFMRSSVRP